MTEWETQFNNLLSIAQVLPWSKEEDHDCKAEELIQSGIIDPKERIYQGLTQYLLEHIVMTSIINNADNFGEYLNEDSISLTMIKTIDALKQYQTAAGVEFENLERLISHYFEALRIPKDQTADSASAGNDCTTDDVCHWSMGCPAKARDTKEVGDQRYPGITKLLKIEIDHYTPKSRVRDEEGMEKIAGVTLCRMHNRQWKSNMLCYGLSPEFYNTFSR